MIITNVLWLRKFNKSIWQLFNLRNEKSNREILPSFERDNLKLELKFMKLKNLF